MACEEKIELQRACTAAWESYEAAAHAAGIPIDHQGRPALANMHKTIARMLRPREDSNACEASPAFKTAFQLRGEHQKASRALSRHLAVHRC